MPELRRSADEAAGAKAEDIAQLLCGSNDVQKLKMQLYALPEVRQQRVDALKQAISDGTYKISPYDIATAMLSDLGLTPG